MDVVNSWGNLQGALVFLGELHLETSLISGHFLTLKATRYNQKKRLDGKIFLLYA
jgi:hypothetical protein